MRFNRIGPRRNIKIEAPKNYCTPYKLKSMKWTFHPYDDDFFPSVPHGHSGKYKLDILTGDVIDTVTKIIIGKINQKEMRRLYSDQRFKNIVRKATKYYRSKFPHTDFKTIQLKGNMSLPNMRSRYTPSNIRIKHSIYARDYCILLKTKLF